MARKGSYLSTIKFLFRRFPVQYHFYFVEPLRYERVQMVWVEWGSRGGGGRLDGRVAAREGSYLV